MPHPGRTNPSSAFPRIVLALAAVAALFFCSCQSLDQRQHLLVSVAEQRMVLVEDGRPVANFPISTSKFGLGDERNSYRTPLGTMVVARKIGCHAPKGAVFRSRQWTGEVLPPDAPGRDPILTRIVWLRGIEAQNRNAFPRMIYIHGTTEERRLGQPVSYGCIRMASADIIELYNRIGVGTPVTVIPNRMPMAVTTASWTPRLRSTPRVAAADDSESGDAAANPRRSSSRRGG